MPSRLAVGISPPRHLTVDDLKRDHTSIPRNPYLARAFYLYGYMEEWGFGTLMMIRECRNQGLPDPVFEDLKYAFKVTLLSKQYLIEATSEGEKEVLKVLRAKKVATVRELALILGKSERTVRRYLTKLIERGLVKRLGRGKYTLLS